MDIEDRMKKYEKVFDHKLSIKTPVILWLDGKAFHTFTRGLNKPFDMNLIETMRETTKQLCEEIQGAKFAYTQSDEIGILLTDWENFETSQWFDYRIQKLASITASMATSIFNEKWGYNINNSKYENDYGIEPTTHEWLGYKFMNRNALFDCRCFNLPMHEVSNWFIWRQQDWMRNSIQMLARSEFSAKELHKKNRAKMKEMLLEKGIDWDKLNPEYLKYGSTFFKQNKEVEFEYIPELRFQEERHIFDLVLEPEP